MVTLLIREPYTALVESSTPLEGAVRFCRSWHKGTAMSGIFGAIQVAKSGLLAHEKALSVVAGNIANVNTPNYVRRKLVFEEAPSFKDGKLEIGRGVEAEEIQRILNSLLDAQIITEQQTSGGLDITNTTLNRMEVTFDETSRLGISGAINELFIAFQSLADNPGGSAERQILVEKARLLGDQFSRVEGDLQSLQRELDLMVPVMVSEINQLTSQIAEMNQDILEFEASGATANNLRDKRHGLMLELADKMTYQYYEDEGGMVSIMDASGHLLVGGAQSYDLQATRKSALENRYAVELVISQSQTVDLTSSLGEGRLGAVIDLRDTVLSQYRDSIDELAAALIVEINAQHRLGYGLDASTNNDFFSPVTPSDVNTDLLTSAQVDSVYVSDYQTVYRSGNTVGDQYTIVFNGDGTYDVTRVSDSQLLLDDASYTSGGTITFDGISIVVSDNPGPAGGSINIDARDLFQGASGQMSVDSAVVSNPNIIAAAGGSDGDPGDNQNALALANMQSSPILNSSQDTFDEYYSNFVTQVFLAKASSDNAVQHQDAITSQLDAQRSSISGVSIDEEMATLLQYQAGFQASARVLDMLNSLLDEILSIIR